MSEKAQRVGILLITLLFVGTTIGVTAYAIYANSNNETQTLTDAQLEELTKQQNQEEPVEPLSCTNDPSLAYTPAPPLAGKPLPNYQTQTDIPQLTCVDVVVGNGAEVASGDTVTAHYTGAIAATGTVFQSSYDGGQPIAFSLNGVIAGWSQGVPGMKEGGKRRILIPSELAYGSTPPAGSGIPADADLVFDVEIVKIGQ
jgi:FKBP-type peptidyl-prolyl cis-trans isomerase